MKDPKVIIGQTTSLGFAGRLSERYYSSADVSSIISEVSELRASDSLGN